MTGVPMMPYSSNDADDVDFQRMPLMTRTSNHTTTTISASPPKVYSSGSSSFISMDSSLKDTLRVNNTDPMHNRDETLLAQNLTSKEKDAIADAFACTPTRGNKISVEGIDHAATTSLLDLVTDRRNHLETKDYSTFSMGPRSDGSRLPFLKAISESQDREDVITTTTTASSLRPGSGKDGNNNTNYYPDNTHSFFQKCINYTSNNICDSKQKISSTLIGAILYSLYSLVFCFAEASAITRPSHPNSEESGLLAPMALMGCVATLVTAPMIISVLGSDYPAPYPALDMFLAPFLAKMAGELFEASIVIRCCIANWFSLQHVCLYHAYIYTLILQLM